MRCCLRPGVRLVLAAFLPFVFVFTAAAGAAAAIQSGTTVTANSASSPSVIDGSSTASLKVIVECPELGREVTVVGSGFQPGEAVVVEVPGIITVPGLTTDSSGDFVVSFLVSPSLPPGAYTVSAVGVNDSAETVSGLQCPSSISYVALGDSYSSGEGAPAFFPGTDGPTDFCHRSVNAYSQVLGRLYGVTPKFYACSGAQTVNITRDSWNGNSNTGPGIEPAQITEPGVDPTASLVTMTIGGNDVGFKDVLTVCIAQKLAADLANQTINSAVGPVAAWLGFGLDPSCADVQSFRDALSAIISGLSPQLVATYEALKQKTSPTDTSIMVADYPHLFPDSASEQSCLPLSVILTPADEQYLNGVVDQLDGVAQSAAARAGVNFAEVRGIFRGHAICGNAGDWINGISFASGNGGSCTWAVGGSCIIGGLPIAGSFHPNAAGQSDGYAAAIQTCISGTLPGCSAANPTPEGFPENPVPDPPSRPLAAAATVPSVAVHTLGVQPMTPGTADCEGTDQAGQTLTVTSGGFAPGAAVGLYVTSPGLGATAEQQVGSATADASGNASATIRIPLAAAGFTPSGASAGLAFVDAIGLGAGGTHVDDTASVGLAPHASSCGTVEPYPFTGFFPPVANPPAVNSENAGRTIPVKFTLADSGAVLSQVLAAGYPQSAPVPCTAPPLLTTGDPTTATSPGSASPGDDYHYLWKTDPSWTGCRELIVKLVDGTYHRAVFDFG